MKDFTPTPTKASKLEIVGMILTGLAIISLPIIFILRFFYII